MVTSKLRNLEWLGETACFGHKLEKRNTNLNAFQKPYFRTTRFLTPYDDHSILTEVEANLEPFDYSGVKLNHKHDALIKTIIRQENTSKVVDAITDKIDDEVGSLRKQKTKYFRGEMDAVDFIDFAETESVVSKARVSEELDSICSTIGGETIDPETINWDHLAKKASQSAKFAKIQAHAPHHNPYQKRIKYQKPLLSVRFPIQKFPLKLK